jgi:Cu/Ag efflux pump CusA
MALVSGSAGLWLQRIQRPWLMAAIRIVIGTLSIAIGVKTGADVLSPM